MGENHTTTQLDHHEALIAAITSRSDLINIGDPDEPDTIEDAAELAQLYLRLAMTNKELDDCHQNGTDCGHYPDKVDVQVIVAEHHDEEILTTDQEALAREIIQRALIDGVAQTCVKCKGIGLPECRFNKEG